MILNGNKLCRAQTEEVRVHPEACYQKQSWMPSSLCGSMKKCEVSCITGRLSAHLSKQEEQTEKLIKLCFSRENREPRVCLVNITVFV